VPDLYFSGTHFGGKRADNVLLPTGYDPIHNSFYGRLRVDQIPEPHLIDRVEVTIRREGASEPIATLTPRSQAAPDVHLAFHDQMIVDEGLPELSPGVYQAEASAYTKDGRLLARARQNFIRYDHGKDLPWIGNKLGVSDKVLKPWTPIEGVRSQVSGVSGKRRDAQQFSVWGRDYRVDGSGLFAEVKAMSESGLNHQKQQMLAGPVRADLVHAGEAVTLVPDREPGNVKVANHEASWAGALSGDGWKIETSVDLHYDGYALHKLRIVPPATSLKAETRNLNTLDALRLVIPLKPEYATHLHAAAGEWFRSTVSSIALGKQNGILWHSGQNHGGGVKPYGDGFGRLMTAGNFKPYVWVGGAHRGIAFMADNDQGWVPDETKKTSAIEVVRKDGQVHLVLNLVARPFAFDKPRDITFSLQATPIKPMQDDFRFRRKKLTMASAFTGGLQGKGGWTWCGGMFNIDDGKGGKTWLFGLPASPPYRVNWDIAEWYQEQADKGGFHGKDWVNTPYQSLQNVHNFPEVDDPRMPPGWQAANTYGYIFPNMSHGHLEHGNPITAQSDMDYRLYQYDNWIKQVGLKGMYFDQTEPVLTKNPKNGFGYVMDLHDRPNLNGKIQPGYGLTRVRQFYKRLRTIFVERGVDFPYIWIHSTDANMVGAFAFTDTLLEGENNPRISESHPWMSEKIPPTRMQAMHNSAGKWGLNMTQLPMIDGKVNHHAHPMHNAIKRCWHGWMMLHDVEPHEGGPKWPGLDLKRRADFLPYWDPAVAAALSTGHDQVFASAWRQDDKLIVLVFNRTGDDQSDVTLRAIPEAFQIASEGSNKYVVVDAEEDKELKCTIDDQVVSVTLPVKARDYRMVRFEQHSPQ
jgi:hypothetical protein